MYVKYLYLILIVESVSYPFMMFVAFVCTHLPAVYYIYAVLPR
jgi:hypothetical protein